MDLCLLDLLDLSDRLASGRTTSLAATQALLDRIARLDGRLHAYARLTAESALDEAAHADADRAAGRARGPLHGVPLAVKDLCWTKGVPTAAGMAIHRDFRPAEDASVVRRLRKAGAVLLGKLQMTEGAYSDHHPSVTAPVNPWGADYWPGISSSGPGVALAAGLCFGAVASDTGGSIRWPSAANGVTGLKPSWGRVSRHGVVELAASLDHVGPMARSVRDVAVLLQVMAGPDPRAPTARQAAVPDYLAAANRGVRGLRLGVDRAWNAQGVDPQVAAALDAAEAVFRELGAQVVEVTFPDVSQALADWPLDCAVQAAVAHAATYPAQREDYGPVLASVIEAGLSASAADYQRALLRRMDLRGRADTVLAGVDVLLTPVHPFAPLSLATIATLGEQPDLIAGLQRYTCPFDMTGHPTLALPGGVDGAGLPIGLQLVAADLGEPALIAAGAAFQTATAWHRRRPALADA
jgi:amidase